MQYFSRIKVAAMVMRNYLLIFGCMMLSLSSGAFAAESRSAGASSDIVASNNQISAQVLLTGVDYTEIGNGQYGSQTGVLDTEQGYVPGHAYTISLMRDLLLGNDYFRLSYDYSVGTTKYVGAALIGGGAYGSVVGASTALLKNADIRYGKGFELRAGMLTPYLELGLHQWLRGVNYGETYDHLHFAVGLLWQYAMANNLVFSLDALSGRTASSNIDIASGTGLIGFNGPLGNSEWNKAGIAFDYTWAPRLHWNIGIDYSTFAYGISATYPSGASVAWEPDSQTAYTTFRMGLGLGF